MQWRSRSGLGGEAETRLHLAAILGGTADRDGRAGVSRLSKQLCSRAAELGPVPLAAAYAIARCDAMAAIPQYRTQRGAHSNFGLLRISSGLFDECHGADAGENHGTRGRYRRASRARRQPPGDIRTVP